MAVSDDSLVMQSFSMMREHLEAAAVELFDGYGIDIERHTSDEAPSAAPGTFAVSAVGFTGDGIRGALVLVAETSAVHAWRRAVDGVDGEVCDTIGEFSNMLLGRLKSKLLSEGLAILLSAPTTAVAQRLSLAPSGAVSTWLTFDGPGWRLAVRLHATFGADFRLRNGERAAAPAEAGDILLF